MPKQNSAKWYANKRVLVTGAGGFIGSHLSRTLRDCGAKVYLSTHGSVDLRNKNDADRLVEETKPEIIFNVASLVNTTRDFSYLEEILRGTYGVAHSVLEAAATHGVQKFIQFGSIDEYGSGPVPFKESQREEPYSPYSLGKTMATHEALTYGRSHDMVVSVVRPAATFGPGQSQRMLIPNIIAAGLAGKDFDMNPGEQLRDFVYVDDVIEGVLTIGANEKAHGEIFNLGSNQKCMVKNVANAVNAEMGNPININFGAHEYRKPDFMEFYMDSGKAEEVLEWRATRSLEEGIKKTVAWTKEHIF